MSASALKMWKAPKPIVKVKRNLFLFPPPLIFYLLLPPFRATQYSGLTLAGLLVTETGREVIYHMLQRKIT